VSPRTGLGAVCFWWEWNPDTVVGNHVFEGEDSEIVTQYAVCAPRGPARPTHTNCILLENTDLFPKPMAMPPGTSDGYTTHDQRNEY
jgi:hypothetical protein